jgi:hypothetical protein
LLAAAVILGCDLRHNRHANHNAGNRKHNSSREHSFTSSFELEPMMQNKFLPVQYTPIPHKNQGRPGAASLAYLLL